VERDLHVGDLRVLSDFALFRNRYPPSIVVDRLCERGFLAKTSRVRPRMTLKGWMAVFSSAHFCAKANSVLMPRVSDPPAYNDTLQRRAIEKHLPHIVETVVPPGGLGERLFDMYGFHAHHSIRARHGLGRRDENGRDIIRWCFAEPATAEDFAHQFGGSIVMGR
jgi:hypothetical protein